LFADQRDATVRRATIRVLLAESLNMVRGALVALLSLEPDFDVVANVATGVEILPAALRERPDVAVLDVNLPRLDAISAAGLLREQLPMCRSLLLTEQADAALLGRAMRAQVSGFLPKDAPADRLADTVRRVRSGERIIDADFVASAFGQALNPLTERERDVLGRVADGADVTEVAARLYLAPGTCQRSCRRSARAIESMRSGSPGKRAGSQRDDTCHRRNVLPVTVVGPAESP
jgi:two-component system, NarL family, response regulator DesR